MKMTVRWWDGYLEVFDDIQDWRSGAYLLWLKQKDGKPRYIPLQQVRWFEPDPNDIRDKEGIDVNEIGMKILGGDLFGRS